MLKNGSKAPAFELRDGDGTNVTLDALLANGPLLLYFYPADFTPICTRQACAMRDLHTDLTAVGLRVVGISPQDPESHRRFAEKYQLPFALLCDTDKGVIDDYEVDGLLGFGVRRASYLISADGRVVDSVLADFRIDRHMRFVRKAQKMCSEI